LTTSSRRQRDVERSVRSELAADPRLGQAAVLVVDNASGEVLAYVGSADFQDDVREGQNDGVRARRQPGSALKPFAYGLALASGWTPASVLSDVDLEVGTAGGAWLPRNYDRRQHGPVRLRAALANSYNVPAVELTEALGPERVLEVLRQAGFASLEASAEHYGAGLVLGNGDVSPGSSPGRTVGSRAGASSSRSGWWLRRRTPSARGSRPARRSLPGASCPPMRWRS
jgi:penicillin-binding protein 1C